MDKTSPRELYILGLISMRQTYGHEIIKAIRVSNASMWVALSDKHVYYVLRKLAGQGLITEREEREGNTPPRKIYEITDPGWDALRQMLHASDLREAFVPSPFDAVLGTLASSDAVGPDEARAILRARRDVLRDRLLEHPATLGETIEAVYGFIARSIFDKTRLLLEAELEWMERLLQRVESEDWSTLRVPRDFLSREGMR